MMTLTSSVMFTHARALANTLRRTLVNEIHDKYSILNSMHATCKIITGVQDMQQASRKAQPAKYSE